MHMYSKKNECIGFWTISYIKDKLKIQICIKYFESHGITKANKVINTRIASLCITLK